MDFASRATETTDGWQHWHGTNVDVTEGTVVVAEDPVPDYVSPEPLVAKPPPDFDAVDVAVDGCGDLYVLTSSGDVYRYDRAGSRLRRLPCTFPGDDAGDPSGIAVTRDSIYVTDRANGSVHVVSAHLLQTRRIAETPFETPVAVVAHGDTAYVLDRGGGGEGDDGAFVAAVEDGTTSVVENLAEPVDLAVDDDGRTYVLDVEDGTWLVRRYDADYAERDAIRVPDDVAPRRLAVNDDALLLGVDAATPEDSNLVRYRSDGDRFERTTRFGGTCSALCFEQCDPTDGVDGVYAVDGDGIVHVLDGVRRRQVNEDTGRYDAQVVTRLDAGESGVQWHRVKLGFDLDGPGTQVRLAYLATDDAGLTYADAESAEVPDLEAVDGIGSTYADRLRAAGVDDVAELLQRDPGSIPDIVESEARGVPVDLVRDWLRDARGLLEGGRDVRGSDWQELARPNPRDALLEDAVGRYLWVKLDLVGDVRSSPRVDSFRAYHPRQSYLRHLPAIYREDERSAAFLERFLSVFESVFTDIEDDIGAVTRFLDPDGVPSEYLSWLESWLALDPGEAWPDAARRELLARAPELFRQRGTRRGLEAVLNVYLTHVDTPSTPPSAGPAPSDDPLVYLFEYADLDCIDDEDAREPYENLLPCPQCFLVLARPGYDDAVLATVERIVNRYQPAHASGRTVPLRYGIELGGNAYLGINTTLRKREFVLEEAGLGKDSVLREREPHGQLGLRSRIGTDTTIS